ncbi:MAG: hypothetical protein HYU52_18255 [Acidobacteria bacterium]|nr:hypothetical protein [Acidobacteriota bacterium]
MIEVYEKRGASVRIERSGRATSTIVAREHGRATRERGRFIAESLGERPLPLAPDVAGVAEAARRISSLDSGRVSIERMTVTAGSAEQTITADGSTRTWFDDVARLHLSLVNCERALRVAIDLGASRVDELRVGIADEIAEALGNACAPQASFNGLVELAPSVSAPLWLFVARHRAMFEGSRLQLTQSTHPSWPFDGAGRRIEHLPLTDVAPSSLFRPSFRVAPAPAWFHIRASLRGVVRPRRTARARVVAMLTPFRMTRVAVTANVLAVSGSAAFAMTLEIPRETFASSITRISRRAVWFPLEAGVWGSDTLVNGASLTS